ncbi:hypothetical protein CANARDRAFT_96905 [[Candida] arabinofermentans NRRL YB-2248]|uniref:VPS37 C-terminal domain-containing protein n=1 Tax=[Candida] arabinofermentans NRRL YB-2248 TaxID=983967 RepID=A0A1E4T6U1_9ASCO|nr:hypothetical protein CANARDRAFT_96905 [[Candida] arabinofermentans NRRL YB-2248]
MFPRPSLPPKPSERSSSQRPQQDQSQTHIEEQIIDYDKLEYPLIPADITSSYLSELEPSMPKYFNDLGTQKLQELLQDQKLLQGYILKNPNFAKLHNDIIEKLTLQMEYTKKLLEKYESATQKKVESLNIRLSEYHEKLDAYNRLQVEMYDKLSKFSKDSVEKTMQQKLSLQDEKCKTILDQLLNRSSPVDEIEINHFVSEYKAERQTYYLMKEKLYRLYEDRVGGFD